MKQQITAIGRNIENLFLWSSGASLEILKLVPSEKNKYFGVGGTVLFTALMATLTGGYAFYTAFQSTGLAVGFGIFWGSLIFNLDRYIVSSFGSGDGKKTISRQELKEASPRLVLAIILGIVISTPLEMKLFEKEITAKLKETNAKKQTTSATYVTSDTLLNSLMKQKAELYKQDTIREADKTHKNNLWQRAARDMNDELYYGKFSGKRGKGTTYQNLQLQATAAQTAYQNAVSNDQQMDAQEQLKHTAFDTAIAKRRRDLNDIVDPLVAAQSENDGFLARFKAFSELSSDEEDNSWVHPIALVKWLIALLFILIEIAPILFKMLTERGPYDDILDRVKYEIHVRQLELQSNLNHEINTAVQIHTAKYNQKLAEELKTNEEVLKAVTLAQQELAIIAINKWKEEQRQKLLKTNIHEMVNIN